FQAVDGIRDFHVTGVQTCALPIYVISAGLASSKVVTLSGFTGAMNYSCERRFVPVSASRKILMVGNTVEAGGELLRAGLHREGCEVFAYSGFDELDEVALQEAKLIFVLIGGIAEQR